MADPTVSLHLGDCLDVLRTLDAGSVDCVVTDPPAGIGFMGKAWDKPGVLGVSGGKAMPATMASRNPICRTCRKRQRTWEGGPPTCACPTPDFDTVDGQRRERDLFIDMLAPRLAEARRVVRPGGFMLCWALPRTSHWTALAIEEAGWTIRDRVTHLFGTGFPKSKSCLKPGAEDWWLCKAPGPLLPLEIDAGRIGTTDRLQGSTVRCDIRGGRFAAGHKPNPGDIAQYEQNPAGRWPANVALSHHEDCNGTCHPDCPVWMLGAQSGELRARGNVTAKRRPGTAIFGNADTIESGWAGDAGTAARFFYIANTGSGGAACRDAEPLHATEAGGGPARFLYQAKASRSDRGEGNTHPTVKSTVLMDWLIRLITPPGGTVLDPFMGSGSTGKAAVRGRFGFVGCELDPDYFAIASRRIEAERDRTPLFQPAGEAI